MDNQTVVELPESIVVNSPITIEQVSGRVIWVPEEFQQQVGDFVVNGFDKLSNGQVAMVRHSLLSAFAESEISVEENVPTVAMLKFIEIAARNASVPVEIQRWSVRELSRRNDQSGVQNPSVPAFMERFSEGLIEYDDDVSIVEVIADACKAFADQPILVVSPHTSEVQRLFKSLGETASSIRAINVLNKRLPDEEDTDNPNHRIESFQVVFSNISTAADLGDRTGWDIARFSVVIYTQAAHTRELVKQGLVYADGARFRLFGLLSRTTKMSDKAMCDAMQVFGSARLIIPKSGFEPSTIGVYQFRNHRKSIRNLARGANATTSINRLVSCTQRNQLIVDIVRSMTTDGPEIGLSEILAAWEQGGNSNSRSTAIICRTYSQAAHLVKGLNGWKIYYPESFTNLLNGMKVEHRNVVTENATREELNDKIIVPLDFFARFIAGADPEYLILACGGGHLPYFRNNGSCILPAASGNE